MKSCQEYRFFLSFFLYSSPYFFLNCFQCGDKDPWPPQSVFKRNLLDDPGAPGIGFWPPFALFSSFANPPCFGKHWSLTTLLCSPVHSFCRLMLLSPCFCLNNSIFLSLLPSSYINLIHPSSVGSCISLPPPFHVFF